MAVFPRIFAAAAVEGGEGRGGLRRPQLAREREGVRLPFVRPFFHTKLNTVAYL
jgi:hypothetical protein